MTVSAGIASYPEHADTAEGLLGAADAAVYDAKLGGRNRTRIALAAGVRDALAHRDRAPHRAEPRPAGASPAPPRRAPRAVAAARLGRGREPLRPRAERRRSAAEAPVQSEAGRRSAGRRSRSTSGALVAATAVVGAPLQPRGDLGDAVAVRRPGRVRGRPRRGPDRRLRARQPLARRDPRARARLLLRPARADRRRGADRARSARSAREPVLKWAFDFGALSLAGAAAALRSSR